MREQHKSLTELTWRNFIESWTISSNILGDVVFQETEIKFFGPRAQQPILTVFVFTWCFDAVEMCGQCHFLKFVICDAWLPLHFGTG